MSATVRPALVGLLAGALMVWGWFNWSASTAPPNSSHSELVDLEATLISTPQGMLEGTLLPIQLADGRRMNLVLPNNSGSQVQLGAVHPAIYQRPASEPATRVVYRDPEVVYRDRVGPSHEMEQAQKRSWEREVLIVAGSAGAGTAIGAVAGGKKGAAIGALSGGVAGLVYDLATRDRPRRR